VPDEEEQWVVEFVRQEVARGAGPAYIATLLQERGVLTRRGAPHNRKSVERITRALRERVHL
jgi:hypothetical protein